MQDTAVVFTHFEFLANREMDMDEIDDLEATQAHHAAPKQSMLMLFYNYAILMKTWFHTRFCDYFQGSQLFWWYLKP